MPLVRQRGVSVHSSDMSRQDDNDKHENSNAGKYNNENNGDDNCSRKRASCLKVDVNKRKISTQINHGNQAIDERNNNLATKI